MKSSYSGGSSPPGSFSAEPRVTFSYSVSITNHNEYPIQLVGRKFTIQAVGSEYADVVRGTGVTNRQPVLKPGER